MWCVVCVTNNTPGCAVLLICDVLYEMMKSDKSDATVQATATTVYSEVKLPTFDTTYCPQLPTFSSQERCSFFLLHSKNNSDQKISR